MTKEEARFWAKVLKADGCWYWNGYIGAKGYGYFKAKGPQPILAHRYSYELHKGPIPDGLEVDHVCRVRHCVNPQHLELVTHAENLRRGDMFDIGSINRTKTHCPHGHEYTEANTYYDKKGRQCRACRQIKQNNRGVINHVS